MSQQKKNLGGATSTLDKDAESTLAPVQEPTLASDQPARNQSKNRKSISLLLELQNLKHGHMAMQKLLNQLLEELPKNHEELAPVCAISELICDRLRALIQAMTNKIDPALLWTPCNDGSDFDEDLVLHEWGRDPRK